jgi:hypothetical protein
MVDSCQAAIFGMNGLLSVCKALRQNGGLVVLGWRHEWDETKQWLQSMVPLTIKRDARLRALSAMCASRFQQQQSGDILVQSGSVLVRCIRADGTCMADIELSWLHPPLYMPSKKAANVLKAVSQGMAFDVQDVDKVRELCECADIVIGNPCADKASTNVATMGTMRHIVAKYDANYLLHETFCELHNINNLKANNLEYVQMVGQLFALANLMRSSDYIFKAIQRMEAAIRLKLKFLQHVEPDPACQARNRNLVDCIFVLDASHHNRHNRLGNVVGKSWLVKDLESILDMEHGDFSNDAIEHCCKVVDPTNGTLCCQNREHCVQRLLEVYVRFYFGRSWPIPATSRFTHVKINTDMVTFAYAHHKMMLYLIGEPPVESKEEVEAEQIGALMSDFQVIHGKRQRKVHNTFCQDPTTPWRVPALGIICNPLDELIYRVFGDGDKTHQISVHALVSVDSSLLAKVGHDFLTLLLEWRVADSPRWALLDAITSTRSTGDQDVRRFVRRQVLVMAGGLERRLTTPFAECPWSLHALVCEECCPTVEQRQQLRQKLLDASPCELSFFGRRYRDRFPTLEALGSQLAIVTLQVWEKMQKFSTKASERQHAAGRRVISGSKKAWNLKTFACRSFLDACRERHNVAGGDALLPSRVSRVGVATSVGPTAATIDPPLPLAGALGLTPDDVAMVLPPPPHIANEGVGAAGVIVAVAPEESPASSVSGQRDQPALGLNPLLFETNKRMQAARTIKGSSLTKEEMSRIRTSNVLLIHCTCLLWARL